MVTWSTENNLARTSFLEGRKEGNSFGYISYKLKFISNHHVIRIRIGILLFLFLLIVIVAILFRIQ
jgi:hypothetical protein